MIKVKDGYAKLIGTTYLGSASRVLLSNGGDIGKAVASTANTLVLRNSSGLIESTLAIGTAPFKVISTTLVNNLNSNYLEGLKRRYRIQLDNVTDTGPYCKLMTIKTNSPYIDQPITFKYSLRTSGSGSTHEGYVTIKIEGKPVSISVTGDLDHNNRFYLYTISEEVITGDNTTTYIGTHELYFKGGSWTSGDFWDIHWGDATKSIVVHENQKTGLQEPTNYIRVLQSTTGRIGGSVHKVVVTQNNTANAYYPLIWASPADGTTSDSQLFKSYNNLTYNPSTKTVTTSCFKAYNTIGTANFIAEGPQNAWAYISFKSGSSNKYHIATNSNSESGALWLGRRDGGDTGIIIGSSIKLRNNPSGIYYYKSDNSYLGYVGYTDLGLGMTTYNAVSGNTFVLKDAGGILTNTNISATNFVSTVSTGTLPYACSSTTLNTNLNADLLDGVHLAGHGGKEGVMRSWARGTYTTVNQYFGNGNVVVIDPKPTDGSTLSPNTIIFSLGDSSIRNTLLAFMYERDEIKYRRVVDGPTWGAWRTIAFTDSDISGTAAYANILKSNSTTSVPKGLLFYSGWLPQGNTNNRSWCSPTGTYTKNSVKGEYGSIVRVNYANTYYNELFFDANSTRPSWRTITGTTSTGWKILGLLEDIRPSGYVTSSTASLSSYWGKLWEYTLTALLHDLDITFYIHSAYNLKRGFVHIRVRRNPVTTDGVTTYTNSVNMLLISGNIPTSDIRLYHDATTGKMELWLDVKNRWGVYNANVISCTPRFGNEVTPIVGTLFSNDFTTVLTLPTYSYITLSNLISNQIQVLQHTINNIEYPLIWSNLNNTNSITADLLYKSYSHLTYNPSNKRITAGSYRGTANGAVLYWGDESEFHLGKNNTTDFYFWSNSTTARLRLGTNGSERLTILANGNVGISNINPSYKLDVNGHTRIYGNLLIGANTTRNYIAFHGTTGDGDGAFNHTYIGENIYYDAESSELVLFKGNDNASNVTNPNGTGPDRIRYIAAGHLFQIYKSPVSGTFESVCTSTKPVNTLAINANDVTSYLNVLPSANNTLNLGSSSLKWANIYSTKFIGALLGNADTATNAINATNADTVDNYHMTIEGNYTVSKSIKDTTNATWYARIELDLSWNGRGHRIICLSSYNNVNGVFILEIPSHSQDEGYIAKVSSYNKCNIKAFCIVRESKKICVYLLLKGYTDAYCAVSSTCNINSLTVVSAPSYNFINVNHKSITTNYEYRINKLAIKHDYPSILGVCIGNRKTNPTLGNLSDSQTAVIGEREYGTTFWTRGSGDGYIQQGRFDGKETAYNLILQALGGNVGINTESPGYKLHVNGTGAFNLSLHLMNGAELHLKAAANSTDPGDIVFKDGNNTEIGRIYRSHGVNEFYVRFSASDSAKTVLHSGNSSVSDYAVKINNTTKNFVRDWGSGATDMNAVAKGGRSSMGMASLSTPSGGTATAVNPDGLTGWHHFINIAYTDGGNGSNSWITQIANKAGSTDLWVRSRKGETIDNTVAWVAGWTRILTGSNYTSVLDGNYVKAYKTLNSTYNIDDNWGLSVVTFDPKAKGTYPGSGNLANFTLLNLGNNFERRKLFGFDWYTDSIFYRRHINSAWTSWVTLLHSGNYSDLLDSRYYTKTESDSSYVNVTGDTMTGVLSMKNDVNPRISFIPNSGSSTLGTIYLMGGSSTTYSGIKYKFRQWSYTANSLTRLRYYEDYNLPETAAGLTANASYTILTTKNASVSGGGSSWGSSITVKINGTTKTLTIPANPNTWRGITDSYSGTDSTISLSQKGGNALYNALVNGYASSAGNADTVDNLHASDFVRAYGTYGASYSYDSDWGLSIITFDPVVSGTYPENNPNITILNLGNNYARRKQLACTYNNNNIYYRRRIDSSWSEWVRLAIAGESYTKGDSDGRYYPISGNVNMSGDNKWIGSTMGGGTDYWRIGGSGTSDNGVCQITIGDNSNDYFQIVIADYTGTNYTALLVKAGGTYAPHFYENSDQRLKENIQAILNKDNIPQIKEFDWKEDGSHSYGLIAQELEEQGYSELVSVKDDGYKTVNYSAALSLIVGKLQVKIKELEKEIENLKNKN